MLVEVDRTGLPVKALIYREARPAVAPAIPNCADSSGASRNEPKYDARQACDLLLPTLHRMPIVSIIARARASMRIAVAHSASRIGMSPRRPERLAAGSRAGSA
jgi:hypothetical protein